MTPEFTPMDAALEQAVAEMRDDQVDSAVIEAASTRVWARLSRSGRGQPRQRFHHSQLRRFSSLDSRPARR